MAAATTRRTRTNGPDTRKPNFQPNAMPTHVTLVAFIEGEEIGEAKIPQNDKLSAAGNVTYKGGITGGWMLDGQPNDTLAALAFNVNGTRLKPSSDGVHQSSHGNPTIFHGGVVELTDAKTGDRRHTVQVYATYSEKHSSYSLSVKVFPAPVATGRPRGPQVVGEVSAGFVLVPKATAPAAA